jgi:hypothetical protein
VAEDRDGPGSAAESASTDVAAGRGRASCIVARTTERSFDHSEAFVVFCRETARDLNTRPAGGAR